MIKVHPFHPIKPLKDAAVPAPPRCMHPRDMDGHRLARVGHPALGGGVREYAVQGDRGVPRRRLVQAQQHEPRTVPGILTIPSTFGSKNVGTGVASRA